MIKLAKKYKKIENGHAPSLTGKLLKAYISAGIDDDHETYIFLSSNTCTC